MARGKRKVPDINSSSTADIAFLLLIFFLITTSMDTDRGLARLLPPPPEEQNDDTTDKIKERTQKNVEFSGTYMVNDKHVISLQNDRGSSYQAYISVQNELVAAYNELRDELATEKFGVKYSELSDEQQKAVREIYPQRISEAEPKKYGEKK